MPFVFRADASPQIGFGHVMRCITLAQALQAAGHDCHFVVRQLPEVLQQRLHKAGATLHWLDYDFVPDETSTFGVDEHADALQTQRALDSIDGRNVLIVDHYGLGLEWERCLRPIVDRLMVIDDLASRLHDCNLLLDQNLGRTETDYLPLVPSYCLILAGTQFTLLRPEFARKRKEFAEVKVATVVHDVLINLGGGDSLPLIVQCLQSMAMNFRTVPLSLTIVTGQPIDENALYNEVKLPTLWSVRVLSNIDTMADILATTDIAIGAAGSSAWERCCLGVPSILFVLADNQKVVADSLAAEGAALVVANAAEPFVQGFQSLLDPEVRTILRANSSLLCDGLGVDRVAAALLS